MTYPEVELPLALTKAPEPLRSGAFHRLVRSVWAPAQGHAGRGSVSPSASQVVPVLCALLRRTDTPEPDRLAFLLGLLAEAEREDAPATVGSVRSTVRQIIPTVLERLASAHADAQVPPSEDTPRSAGTAIGTLREGALFLLGQFPEDHEAILASLAASVGEDASSMQALRGVFALASRQPRRAQSILAYLGAEAAHRAGPDREAALRSTLACPACQGSVDLSPEAIACTRCHVRYPWIGDVPSMLRAGEGAADQFPAARVAEYETGTRPRFVRVMTGDFERHITPEVEASYLRQWLRPVEGLVLDLACGAGGWTHIVGEMVGVDRVLALDYSVAMLDAVGARVPRALRVHASASSLPVQNSVLAGVNCSDALQALPDPATAIREVARCLRPGAPFTCFTMLEAPQPYAYFQARFPDHERTRFTPEQLTAMISDAGLRIVDWHRITHGLFVTATRPAA